jgi:hypothetical protein
MKGWWRFFELETVNGTFLIFNKLLKLLSNCFSEEINSSDFLSFFQNIPIH